MDLTIMAMGRRISASFLDGGHACDFLGLRTINDPRNLQL